MKTLLKIASGALFSLACLNANAIYVGGVEWNPNAPNDYIMQFNFTQWYTSSADAIGSSANEIPDYDAALTAPGGLLPDVFTPTVDDGSVLTGTGEVYNINGTGPGDFCPSCELTVVFGGIELETVDPITGAPTFDVDNSFVNIYVDKTLGDGSDYPHPNDAASQDDVDAAADGDLWLSLTFETFSVIGDTSVGFLTADLSVTGGLAASHFQDIGDIFSFDADYIGSAFVSDGTYTLGGNGTFISNTIPEPTSLALLGLGLLGFGAASRRRK